MTNGNSMPEDTSVEAEYSDGFVLSETKQHDTSLYADGRKTFYDILEKRPEPEHGHLVRFSCYYRDARYDIDWTELPANARPIRFRDGQATLNTSTGEQTFDWTGCRFGYQYNDEQGRNKQVIQEL